MLTIQVAIAAALLALLIGRNDVAQSQETPPQPPQARTDQQPSSAEKRKPEDGGQASATSRDPKTNHMNAPSNRGGSADASAVTRDDGAREYWPFLIFGAHLKITDSFLSLFTFILIIVGAMQGYFLYRTDKGTHAAADAAKRSADATRVLVDQEYRGYLFIKEFEITRMRFRHPDGSLHKVFRLAPIWQNFGKVPAIVRRNYVTTRILTVEGKIGDIDWTRKVIDPVVRMPVGPGFPMQVGADIDIEMDHAIRLSQNKERYFALIRVEYGRMTEETAEFHTQICIEIKFGADPVATWDNQQINAAKVILQIAVPELSSAR